MVYTRVLHLAHCILTDDSPTDAGELEPGKILEAIPKEWTRDTTELIVTLTDGHSMLEYDFDKFLARSYPIAGDTVAFGLKKLNITKLSIVVGIKIKLQDLSELMPCDVD
jgi:hypothetical protein